MIRQIRPAALVARVPYLAQACPVEAVAAAATLKMAAGAPRAPHHRVRVVCQQRAHLSDRARRLPTLLEFKKSKFRKKIV